MMWSRKDLKLRALAVLSGKWWDGILICYIVGLLGGNGYTVYNYAFQWGTQIPASRTPVDRGIHFVAANPVIIGLFFVVMVLALVSVLISALMRMMFTTGTSRYFLELRQGRGEMRDFFFAFRQGRAGHVLLTEFLRGLFTFLWTLLLIVPGIVKAFEYAMIPYILAENPRLSQDRVFAVSKSMMDGEKWRYFILVLSFMGWGILCLFTAGIGFYVLQPYIETTRAEFYAAMRDKVLYQRLVSPEELPGMFAD